MLVVMLSALRLGRGTGTVTISTLIRKAVLLQPPVPPVACRLMMTESSNVQPSDVLKFWFGEDFSTRQGDPDPERLKMWFIRNKDVDATARQFIPQIRAAGKGQLGEEWQTREGLTAQLVLLDQLSRNAFRGDSEAYAYDERATEIALKLVQDAGQTPHELPVPSAIFVITTLMHSENIEFHTIATAFAKEHCARSKSAVITQQLQKDLPEHKEVLIRFGHYPHRNAIYGRSTTVEEQSWLQSDDCPGWAKSQIT